MKSDQGNWRKPLTRGEALPFPSRCPSADTSTWAASPSSTARPLGCLLPVLTCPLHTQALSVGIFPYVLKLLQSSARELRPLLVFIWAKILAVDSVSSPCPPWA